VDIATRTARTGTRTLAVVAITIGVLISGTLTAFANGIDVSRWQHQSSLDWSKVKADGVDFAFIKATEGSTYTNPYFAGDWASTTKLGIYRGAYHFARPSVGSAATQAKYFVKVAGLQHGKGVLPPVLDLEATGGLGVKKLRNWTRNWLVTVQNLTGRAPIIYVSPSFWETNLGNSTGFHNYPLWVAHYGVSSPRVPGGWPTWTFWQKTSSGKVSGIAGRVDINRFNGNDAQLAKMANTTSDGGTGTPTGPTAPPGPTTTKLSINANPSSVTAGGSVEFTGLFSTNAGRLPNLTVGLWRQYDGATTATRIALDQTGPHGGYAFRLQPQESASYYVRWGGNKLYARTVSPTRRVALTGPVPTTLSMKVSSTQLYATDKVTFTGNFRTASHVVADREIGLWRQPATATRARRVLLTNTDASGNYSFTFAPTDSASYYTRWGGGPLLAVANSTPVNVSYLPHVPTSVSLAASQPGAYPGQSVTLSGKLSALRGSVSRQTVTVQRQVDGSTAPSTEATLTTDRSGGFSYTFEPTATAQYVVSYAGKDSLGAASSDKVRVEAKQPTATKVDLIANRVRTAAHRSVAVHGHLRTKAGKPVAGKRVVVFRRLVGSSTWTRMHGDVTTARGFWRVLVRPGSDAVFRAEFLGSTKFLPSKSARTRIDVR
jgi:GH25 family lysozyme M1 (1,4-beta-N-acetylmuramidase)